MIILFNHYVNIQNISNALTALTIQIGFDFIK